MRHSSAQPASLPQHSVFEPTPVQGGVGRQSLRALLSECSARVVASPVRLDLRCAKLAMRGEAVYDVPLLVVVCAADGATARARKALKAVETLLVEGVTAAE